jgi:glycine/D-amino acid oxidase-like deaminating enzyme
VDAIRRDVVIVGGGIYGCFLAEQLASRFPQLRITVLEREGALFSRASSTNQGQLHKGYMYSIDPDLAVECQRSVGQFEEYFHDAIDHDVTAYYGIHRDSQIDPAAYADFCREMGIPLRPVAVSESGRFGPDVVAAYATSEQTFNCARVHHELRRRLAGHGVEVRLSHDVRRIVPRGDGSHLVVVANGVALVAGSVYNTTFADINALHNRCGFAHVPIRCEVFLHFLLRLPPVHARAAITVIRGPFASLMPSMFRGGHLLAAAGYRKLRSSDLGPPSEHLYAEIGEKIYTDAVEHCSTFLPVLREAVPRGNVIGTRAAFIDLATGETTSRVTALLDFAGITNYHVIVGGKVGCLFEARDPALRAAERIA